MKYCPLLFSQLIITNQTIQPCCSGLATSLSPPAFRIVNKESFINLDEYCEFIANAAKKMQLENSPCSNCTKIETRNVQAKTNIFFKNLNIALNETICNCKCYYCNNRKHNADWAKNTVTLNNINDNFIYHATLSQLENVIWYCGECTIQPKFKETLYKLSRIALRHIFYTNAIKFSSEIADLLAQGRGELSVSLDSGTEDTYYRVKGVNKFTKTVRTLQKYSDAIGKTSSIMKIKYILLKENTNARDMASFLILATLFNADTILISMNQHDLVAGKDMAREFFFYHFLERAATELGICSEVAENIVPRAMVPPQDAMKLHTYVLQQAYGTFEELLYTEAARAADGLPLEWAYVAPEWIAEQSTAGFPKKRPLDINTSETFRDNFSQLAELAQRTQWHLLGKFASPFAFIPKASRMDCDGGEYAERKFAIEHSAYFSLEELDAMRASAASADQYRQTVRRETERKRMQIVKQRIDRLNGKQTFLYGAGAAYHKYRHLLDHLSPQGVILSEEHIPEGRREIAGLPVLPLEHSKELGTEAAVILLGRECHIPRMMKEARNFLNLSAEQMLPCYLATEAG